MKKITFLAILFAITLQVHAQEFAPIGAIWHFTQGTSNPNLTTFKTFESVLDTTINGIQCRKVIEVERYIDTTNVFNHYMYSKNDSVFFYADNDFQLLYDFGAVTGDTLVLDYFGTYYEIPLRMIIDSTGTIMVNDQERKIQYITCGDGIVIEFGPYVIEGIGSTSFMFPGYDLFMDGPLRCYQDNSTGLFLNPFNLDTYGWNHQDCEEIITGVKEIEGKDGVFISPNPTNNTITIQNIDRQTTYSLFNVNGKLLLHGVVFESGNIDISGLSRGIYFIKFDNGDTQTVKKLVKN